MNNHVKSPEFPCSSLHISLSSRIFCLRFARLSFHPNLINSPILISFVSHWYNCNALLDVKHQVTHLLISFVRLSISSTFTHASSCQVSFILFLSVFNCGSMLSSWWAQTTLFRENVLLTKGMVSIRMHSNYKPGSNLTPACLAHTCIHVRTRTVTDLVVCLEVKLCRFSWDIFVEETNVLGDPCSLPQGRPNHVPLGRPLHLEVRLCSFPEDVQIPFHRRDHCA